jgi:Phosphate/sulphate permeases
MFLVNLVLPIQFPRLYWNNTLLYLLFFLALLPLFHGIFCTWRLGIPSSSSHTLIGGFAGAAICGGGFQSIHTAVIVKIAAFIVLAPVIGMVISSMITIGVLWLFKGMNARTAENSFRKLQLVSSGLFSLGHGLNDSQKVMGIIATALISYGSIDSVQSMPDWVPLCCFAAIGLGTMSGGWRIVKTMGSKITKVTALEGVCAESAGAVTLFITEILKIPVSTTHTITGSIMGVGAVKRLSAVRWGVTINLMWAWILTIPVSAVLAGLIYLVVNFIGIK